MKPITFSFPTEAQKFIVEQAKRKGISIELFILDSIGWQKENEECKYTANDFNEETIASINTPISEMESFANIEDAIAEMSKW